MYCKNCGYAVGGNFCEKCGSSSNAGGSFGDSGNLVFVQTRAAAPTSKNAQTSGLAVGALVATFFIPLLGIILGFVARSEISNSRGMKSGDGLANLAIILGFMFTFLYVSFIFAYFAIWFA
jgi:hypothetical protein